MKYISAVFFILVLLSQASCGGSSSSDKLEVILTDLPFPVRAAVLDSENLLVAELGTGILFQYKRASRERINLFTFVSFSPEGDGISGLLVDRDYVNNGFVFVYHTSSSGMNVLTRLVLQDGVILDNKVIRIFTRKGSHNGGGMYQLPNGNILVGTGDGDTPAFSQDPDRLEGKIVIVNREGEPVEMGNGLPPGIYALGFRNPFGIDGSGEQEIYVADNGPECDDEINRLQSGGNYGWRSDYVCGQHFQGHIAPIYVWNPSEGITDLIYIPSRKIVLTSLFNLNSIRSLQLDASGARVSSENEILINDEPVVGMSYLSDDAILFTTPTRVYGYKPDFTDSAGRL